MQDARMLLPGGARGRVLLRAGHQRLERLEERLDAHPRAPPGLQDRWRQGGRGQRHPGAPPLQSHRPLLKGRPFAREGSREDQESPRARDPPQQFPDREHRGRRDPDRRRHRRGDRRAGREDPSRRRRQRRRSRRRRRMRRNGSPCRTPRRRSTSSTTRRSPIAPGPRSLGSRARSATPSSIASWGFRRRLRSRSSQMRPSRRVATRSSSTFGPRSVASPAAPGMRHIRRSVADQLPRFVSATLRNASRRSVAPAVSSSGAHPPER